MSQQDDFDRGLRNRRAMLGDEYVDRSIANTTEFNAEFQDHVTRHAWNDIWGRPELDAVTRRLLVLGMTMGLARWEEFELHCRAAIRGGVPLAKIKETLMQGAIYCGVPAANTGFKITTEILRAEGLLPALQPLSDGVRASTHHTFSQPQLKVAVQGQGSPVVLSHALGLDMNLWAGLARALAAAGHEVLRYDHRGHGGSAVPPGPYTLDALVDDAERVVREWGRGPVVFVGISMGGMVAQGLALRCPELVRGLVLAHTGARYPAAARAGWQERIDTVQRGGMEAVLDASMARFFSAAFRGTHPAAVADCRARLSRTSVDGYVATCQGLMNLDWLDRLPELRCPTLIVAGELDEGTPMAFSQAMAERISGSKLEVLQGAAHLGALEQAERFNAMVQAFLVQRAL
jgi:3-oxoadipate enol-lactonase